METSLSTRKSWPARGGLMMAALVFFIAGGRGFAQEGPRQVIERSNEKILALYAEDEEEENPGTSAMVFEVMDEVTSFAGIASAAIDGLCDPEAGDDCETFKQVFQDLLRVSSVNKLGRYRAERFEYVSEDIDGDTAIVRTIAWYGDDDIELDYHLGLTEDDWVISNYVVDGVDTIKNYRKQFSRMLRTQTVDSVVGRLEKRTEELEGES